MEKKKTNAVFGFLAFAAAIGSVCAQDRKGFSISGTIKGKDAGQYAYLYKGNEVADSVKIANGTFVFKGSTKDTVSAQIAFSAAANAPKIYLENSDMKLSVSIEQAETKIIARIENLEGSRSAVLQEEYKQFYIANKSKPDFGKILYKKLQSFLKDHAKHPFSGAILAELALYNPILTKSELQTLYKLVDESKQHPQDLKLFAKGIANLDVYAVGKPFPDFSFPDQNGKAVDSKSLKGKIVLVDFWASWCAPCRAKHPELVRLNQDLDRSKFAIVGISEDKNKKQWLGAMAKDKLDWTNLIDQERQLQAKLGIVQIPYSYLVDANGLILKINPTPAEIEQAVSGKG